MARQKIKGSTPSKERHYQNSIKLGRVVSIFKKVGGLFRSRSGEHEKSHPMKRWFVREVLILVFDKLCCY